MAIVTSMRTDVLGVRIPKGQNGQNYNAMLFLPFNNCALKNVHVPMLWCYINYIILIILY
jgi:hypothetical protein